ncbi:MAG: peptidylprolyl isomerase, partial [Bacteroidales bacterium]|nr:peptidylprolyl isomerase [Bacteroidales bacterium]
MKKLVFGSLISLLIMGNLWSQGNNKTFMTIDNEKISKDEFVRIYKKNNAVDSEELKNVDDYMKLFINFKLKVHDAEMQGLDTSISFKKELESYKKQLVKPYLTDSSVDNRLMKEAYDRMHYDIHAAHILILVAANATPKDTLIAYNKAWKIYKGLKAGKNFAEEAKKYSEDKQTGPKGGDLGYFTVFQMVYSFESTAFNTPVGEFSKPVKSRFGYHIVKVLDKRPNKGRVKVAHIMVTYPKGANQKQIDQAKAKIDSVYDLLQKGNDFTDLAKKYSEDKGSARKGGELNWFGTGQMIPTFEKAAFSIKNKGDYSKPIQTSFGWHIIKLIDREPIKSFDEVKYDIKNKMSKDARAQKSRETVIAKLKKEYSFSYDKGALSDFFKVVDDSIFFGKWKPEQAAKRNKTLFTLAGKKYSQQEYVKHLALQKRKLKKEPISSYINKDFQDYINQFVIDYEITKLPEKYPEFNYLLKEYHDGILLFNLMDQKVWSKAIKDTVGLKEFYEKTKNKYMWDNRVSATIYKTKDGKIAKKLEKALNTRSKKNLTDDEILDMINKKDSTASTIEVKGVFSKDDNQALQNIDKTYQIFEGDKNKAPLIIVKDNMVFEITQILPPQPKALKDIRGLVIADYQNTLEKEWITQLKEKYKVTINQPTLI